MRRLFLCLLGLACLSSGCQMLKWVQPHQLWKLNRQPAISRDDAYFSVPAHPLPTSAPSATAEHQTKSF